MHWSTQKNAVSTFLSFMNVHKYPPSLLYMCATVGIGILFLAFAGHKKNWLTRFITVYGRVPFLYYVLHFFLIHLIASFAFWRGDIHLQKVNKPQERIIPAVYCSREKAIHFSLYILSGSVLCFVVSHL